MVPVPVLLELAAVTVAETWNVVAADQCSA